MLVVGIGGTGRPFSATEAALEVSLNEARRLGADVVPFPASSLRFSLYDPSVADRSADLRKFVEALVEADGVIIASPGYHGSVSGLVKNALDYVEDLATHEHRPYLDDLPVGCIAVSHGWQAAVNTLRALRDIVHSLRAWPTPYGAAINSAEVHFGEDGKCSDQKVAAGLQLVAAQVVHFASMAAVAKATEDWPPSDLNPVPLPAWQ